MSFQKITRIFINTLVLVISVAFGFSQNAAGSFKAEQLKNKRVKKAYENKYELLKAEIKKSGFDPDNFELYLRSFKKEKELQVWMKNKSESKFRLFKTYSVCASSGDLGPKRKEGDGQVPEGFYEIEHFNPQSNYHLSLKVNYPNSSDKIRAKGRTGGDIMVHGNCVTIGCIPIEDDPIEELYIMCLESKNRKNNIRIDIFPCKFTVANLAMLNSNYSKDKNEFWEELKQGYDYFELNRVLPRINTDKKGTYIIVK